MSDIVRNFLGLIFLSGADIIVVAIFVTLIIANYLACQSAFYYLGYEGLPLAREAFIGQIIGPFFPEITLAHLYAFVISAVIALGLFILSNRLFHIRELLKDRQGYLAQNDSESAQIILSQIYDCILLIVALLACLIPALNWDFELFRYRSVLGALGIDDPARAPMTVENWDNQLKNYGHYFAWQLALVGAFGYLAITGLSCIALEFTIRRTTDRFLILLHNIEHIFQPVAQQEERALCGFDSNRQPVYDPAVPVAYDTLWNPVKFYGYDPDGYPVYDPQTPLAYDTDGNPIKLATVPAAEPNNGNGTATSSQEHHQHTTNQIASESSQDQRAAGTLKTKDDVTKKSDNSNDSQGSLFDDEETFQTLGGERNEDTQLKDVIGKAERVGLATAMADNERYWVDPDSLEIWDRDYRRTLFPGTC